MKKKNSGFKGKQILLFGLVALVIAAGYYRWTTETNSNSYVSVASDAKPKEEEQKEEKAPGLSKTRQDRDERRSSSVASWQEILDNENASQEDKDEAENKIRLASENAEKEGTIETLIKAKGFEDCLAIIENGDITIIVSGKEIDDTSAAQVKEIVVSKAGIPAKGIKLSHE